MEKDLMIILRANILGGMNTYIIENYDEDTQGNWANYGVPDGADEDDLIEIAKNDKLWVECCKCFANCL